MLRWRQPSDNNFWWCAGIQTKSHLDGGVVVPDHGGGSQATRISCGMADPGPYPILMVARYENMPKSTSAWERVASLELFSLLASTCYVKWALQASDKRWITEDTDI
ncbi:hypothetical protein Salat_2670300 [Sesamum alatum]|uniref:Uncharacterized protein n=1 Tax=Sesamum alatum TaxID=300844 RepID=A0AAE1XPG6_9LAMI|nr:hypothetical protein Salat_2670300 [Sesamum alatum]